LTFIRTINTKPRQAGKTQVKCGDGAEDGYVAKRKSQPSSAGGKRHSIKRLKILQKKREKELQTKK